MDFLKLAKYFFTISAALTIASIVLVFVPGPRLGIEFTGGTRMEIAVTDKTLTPEKVETIMKAFTPEVQPTVNRTQNGNFLIKMTNIDDPTHQSLLAYLKTNLNGIEETQYTTIGPTVGATLKTRAAYAVIATAFGIILYLAWAFRKVPRKYSPWKFGVVAVATLLHDVMVTVGVFVVLSRYTTFEVDTLFVTALLTVLGYSVNDTIIVFDRIRDNLFMQDRKEDFAVVANRSVNQTWVRSCYTSGAVLIMLLSLLFLGSASITWFVLTLVIGVSLGTYSSIFVATPLLVYWNNRKQRF